MLPDLGQLLSLLTAPHQEDPERDHVLDAAQATILDFGVRRASMGEIARRSGISPATLYRWYQSKQQLLTAVIMRELRQFSDQLMAAFDDTLSPTEQLTEVTVLVSRRLQHQPMLQRLLVTDPDVILHKLTIDGAQIILMCSQLLATHLRGFMDAGRIPEGDATLIAELMTRVIHSLSLTPQTAFPIGDEDRVRELSRDLIGRLLSAP